MADITGSELRAARGELTQAEVAARVGIRRETLSQWEQRAVVKPSKASRVLAAIRDLASDRAAA